MVSRLRVGFCPVIAQSLALACVGTFSLKPEKLSLGLQLKHCEDPVVIDDGDSPPDQEPQRLPAEPQSLLIKSQDTVPVVLPQGLGLQSRPGQLSGDPGREPGAWGRGLHIPPSSLLP